MSPEIEPSPQKQAIPISTEPDTPTPILSPDIQSLLQSYAQQRPDYEAFEAALRHYFLDLFSHQHLELQLESRTKTLESVQEKILRQNKHYHDPLSEITDFIGIRLICYYLEDIDRVGDILRKAFEIDWKNSIDRRSLFLDPDRFGYQSVHYVIGLKAEMAAEAKWQPFQDLKAEVQVRTVLQHAWAAIEHRLQYKAEKGIPRSIKRRFYRLSALLELADEEFMAIRKQTHRLRQQHQEDLMTGNLSIEIDRYSLTEYLKSSKIVTHWVEAARDQGYRVSLQNDYYSSMATTRLLEFLSQASINLIGELDHILHAVDTGGEVFLKEFLQQCRQLYGPNMTLNAAPQFLIPHLICFYYRHSDKLGALIEAENLGSRAERALENALCVFQNLNRNCPPH